MFLKIKNDYPYLNTVQLLVERRVGRIRSIEQKEAGGEWENVDTATEHVGGYNVKNTSSCTDFKIDAQHFGLDVKICGSKKNGWA